MSQEEERSVHRVVVASKFGRTREVAGELGQGDRPKPEDAGPEGISEAADATSSRPSGVRKLDRDALGRVERPMVRARRTPEGDFRAGNAISAAGSRRGGVLVSVLAGLFLIAHGLVHLVVWVPAPEQDAPFDPGHSWLLGEIRRPARAVAATAAALLSVAGILVLAGAGAGADLAVVGAAVSVALVALTFHPWLLGAVAIDVAVAVVALT